MESDDDEGYMRVEPPAFVHVYWGFDQFSNGEDLLAFAQKDDRVIELAVKCTEVLQEIESLYGVRKQTQ